MSLTRNGTDRALLRQTPRSAPVAHRAQPGTRSQGRRCRQGLAHPRSYVTVIVAQGAIGSRSDCRAHRRRSERRSNHRRGNGHRPRHHQRRSHPRREEHRPRDERQGRRRQEHGRREPRLALKRSGCARRPARRRHLRAQRPHHARRHGPPELDRRQDHRAARALRREADVDRLPARGPEEPPSSGAGRCCTARSCSS